MKKILLILIGMFLSFNFAKAVDDDCLFIATDSIEVKLTGGFYDNFGFISTDVYIDTCGLTDINGNPYNLDSLGTLRYKKVLEDEKRYYAKEMYKVIFQEFPFDSTKNYDTTHFLNVNNIKQKLSGIKSDLQSLTGTTGEIKFYKHIHKHKTFSMETAYYNTFYVEFENPVNAIETAENINNIDGIECEFMSYFKYPKNSVFQKHDLLTVYPNPANEVINLEFPAQIKSLQISNMNGDKIKEFSKTELTMINSNGKITIETAGFPPGIYFLIIDSRYFEKIVVKR